MLGERKGHNWVRHSGVEEAHGEECDTECNMEHLEDGRRHGVGLD